MNYHIPLEITVESTTKDFKIIINKPKIWFKDIYYFIFIEHPRDSVIKDCNLDGMPYGKVSFFDYQRVLLSAAITYSTYNNVKDIKDFDELIKKIKTLSIKDVRVDGGNPERNFFHLDFDFNKFPTDYFCIYVVAKWLKLKPNKEFKPIFEKIAKLLDDKKWW